MEWVSHLTTPDKMPFMVAIVAILVGGIAIVFGCVTKIVKMAIVHRERMAKIEQGIDPDNSLP